MNPKIENILQMSIEATDYEKLHSDELRVGYDSEALKWEFIIKYVNDIDYLTEKYRGIEVRKLANQYAIVTCEESYIYILAEDNNIEMIEKPKRIFFDMMDVKRTTCIMPVQRRDGLNLYGRGVIVAVIDSGIDIYNREFRKNNGDTRIINLMDQNTKREYHENEINEILHSNVKLNVPGRDMSGHGTKVAAIACGNSGVASEADIIIVRMGVSHNESFPRTTNLMEAVDYVIKKAIEHGKPVAINISFGNNYGDHRGTSLIERYIDDITLNWKCSFCIGSGNEGLGATHTGGNMKENMEHIVELGISSYETSLNIQIWKEYWDELEVEIVTPRGRRSGTIVHSDSISRMRIDGNIILVMYGNPSPYSTKQEIYIELLPQDLYITDGIWKIILNSKGVVEGRYDMWLPSVGVLNRGTGFLRPDSSMSCTIPGTSKRVLTVGAYDAKDDSVAPFSGRSYIEKNGQIGVLKPEIVAPGVDIVLNETDTCTGTSCASPVATGSAALLMEWGDGGIIESIA